MTKVADNTFGNFMKFIHDIVQRVLKGSLDPQAVMQAIRPLIGQPVKITLNQALINLKEAMVAKVGDNHYIDSNIKNWFNENEVNAEPQYTTTTNVHLFPKDISHRDIQRECQKRGDTYEPYLVQGIIDATVLIEQGEIDTPRKGVIIYLTNKRNGYQCGLHVWRNSVGSLSVDLVNPGNVWLACDGVLRKDLKSLKS